jgi:acylphosphatase
MVIKRQKLLLRGKVQGVFFRDFAKQNANKLGLVGYAKNLKDGKLEILVQGEDKKIEAFVRLCRTGPIFAKVDKLDIEEEQIEDPSDYEFFDIRYS